ncbi:protein prenylyltransferase [Cryphonectria parasitica EP155]|uniref:Geranylgeranyl transferase type-2 subunit alpha n=1 Tax=Cryphonectria parasitica (strain ATCC 38755 / EP155) TaxID=660469 RepID=A0A9P4Y3M4_CRYP1|nr:protein prenylyltransferase [Cryphonectria parasitica EP155]KAF3765525.1 protein prenylyltransferase [Cryphonectria parasitica EP155]
MEFPKCYWIWKYRSWLLQQAIDRLEPSVARRIWEEELGLDTKMLTKDRRNFHAWGYRRNVVGQLESEVLNGKSMVESEFDFTTKMIHVDLSNFSAWHNRSKLIPRLLVERGTDDAARRKFFDDELALIREALNVGPDDQSLWYYHQFLMLDLVKHVDQPTITISLTNKDRVTYITREIEDIKDLLEDYDDCKLIYERLMDYTLALAALEQRSLRDDEQSDLKTWLSKVRELDPMKKGRWDDLERQMGLGM